MEAFLAANEAQWEVIKKVIDECDYYILIIGGRYGSITSDGISYTEKEYNYAKLLNIPVLGFVHGEPENISVSKTEREENGRSRLETFRARVMAEHPIRKWTSPQELGGLVSRSISRAIKVNPRPGWIRNLGPSNLELMEQINVLTRDNAVLRERIKTETGFMTDIDELESGLDELELFGSANVYDVGRDSWNTKSIVWQATASWDDIFRDIGPILMNEASEVEIKNVLAGFIAWSNDIDRKLKVIRDYSLTPESFAAVIVQLRALGLVDKGVRKPAVSDRGSYWALTEAGERYLVRLLARKKGDSAKALPDGEP